MTYKKKLIEVALPLEAINVASAREKSIRHGHPSTLHLWWARRPLAAARAVIFAQMVDDPSAHPDLFKTEEAQEKERQRLFRIIEELVKWENTTNEIVLQQAREEIWQSWRYTCTENADHPRAKELFDSDKLPAFHDPFAGGGALPLEAQRLGLESYASDLNPVAVLINKAMIQIPPKFAGKPPVNPDAQKQRAQMDQSCKAAQGLAEDVRYYGQWMRREAEKRIAHLYPRVEVTPAMAQDRPDLKKYVGQKLTAIAYLWARTVKSPNPAFGQVDVPLASTFMLSTKVGKEAYIEPVIEGGGYRFTVKVEKPNDVEGAKNGTKLPRANFSCLMSGTPITGDYIKAEGKAGRVGARLLAMVAEGERERVFLDPTESMEAVAYNAKPKWTPDVPISGSTQYIGVQPYGLDHFSQLFTDRQLVALTTFSDLVEEVRQKVKHDALAAGLKDDDKDLAIDGTGATTLADAVATYLGLCVSKSADYWSNICIWRSDPKNLGIGHVFARQAIPMTWDYAEANPFSTSSGSWLVTLDWISRAISLSCVSNHAGNATQADAARGTLSQDKVISTDPPYYDNVPYADLSDFFYVWLRGSLKGIFPELFATLAVPKAEELVAFAYRHDGKAGAEAFFLDGMTRAMHRLAEQAHPAFPVSIYYAFKQAENDGSAGIASTGWETFLDAMIQAGFATTGTWPMRTEMSNRTRGMGSNALASSIVLVCRRRAPDAPTATRREFVAALKAELPLALAHLQHGNIAPVDLAQAAIGPGMGIYTRYAKVLDAEGKPLSVRAALALINQNLDEALAEQEGDFDADSRWALTWFEQSGFAEGDYGVAEQLSKSKNTAVAGLVEAGILVSKAGKVRLLKPAELPADWDPTTDTRLTVWEMVHQLIRALEAGGENAAAALVAKLGSKAEIARELCYRLYRLCERKKRANESMAYNGLVQSWPEISRLASEKPHVAASGTADMFDQE
jgi:putative DNA methylase